MAAGELPGLLAAALSADNALRGTAEARLAVLGKEPGVVLALLEQLQRATDTQVRQLAAIMLRKRVGAHWSKLPEAAQSALMAALLEAIVREPWCVRGAEPPPPAAADARAGSQLPRAARLRGRRQRGG
jgi:hypothetical protein